MRVLVVLFLATTTVSATYCPNGAIDYGDVGECILAVPVPSIFDLAQTTCNALGGRVAQIYNDVENLLAVLTAWDVVSTDQPLITIGVRLRDNTTRVYADGTPLNYVNFASGDEYAKISDCSALNITDFKWYATDCQTELPFLCTMGDQNQISCPSGWVHNDKTDACYYAQTISPMGPIASYTQAQAETLCKSMGAHLVSIHSDQEDIFIRNLIATSRKDILCHDWEVVIGASCSNATGKTWTDGSAFDFDLTKGSCSGTYAMMNDQHCVAYLQTRWDDWDSTFSFSRFVCKKPAN
ncbi:unnamed protein product, partial [Mesorhabditis spiculigera]